MKIVVQGTNWIGDSVMSIPALRALRQVFPDAEIALHTRSWAEEIFRDADFIDHLITYDRPQSSFAEVRSQARALRQRKFDIAVIFPNSFASALTTRLARIPKRIGFSKESRRILLTDAIDIPTWKSERHEAFYYLKLIEELESRVLGTSTASSVEPSISLTVSDERKQKARKLLQARGLDLTRPLVAFGPGSTNSMAKRWPEERYAELADRLAESGASILLLGGPDDRNAGESILAKTGSKVLDLIGETSLGEAAAILSVCDLMISNDMGLAHLAPAVGSRTIVLFGPTNPVTTRPLSELAEVIRVDVECSPCMLRECPIDHRCMTRITVDQVFASAISALKTNDRTIAAETGDIYRP
jgi:heptosyltransferase-2